MSKTKEDSNTAERYSEPQPEKISDLFPEIDDYIYNLCIDENIDPNNIPANKFNYILLKVKDNYILPNKHLLQVPFVNGAGMTTQKYDPDSIILLYNYYCSLCFNYNIPITLKRFYYLSGISNSTMYNSKLGEILNSKSISFNKRVQEDSEQSFLDYGLSNKTGSVVALAALNHRFGWNDSKPALENSEPETACLVDLKNEFGLFLEEKD